MYLKYVKDSSKLSNTGNNNDKNAQLFKNGQKIRLDIPPKKTCDRSIGKGKDAQPHSSLAKCESNPQGDPTSHPLKSTGQTIRPREESLSDGMSMRRTKFLRTLNRRLAKRTSNPLPGSLRRENVRPPKDLYANVHHGTFHNSEKLEITHTSVG